MLPEDDKYNGKTIVIHFEGSEVLDTIFVEATGPSQLVQVDCYDSGKTTHRDTILVDQNNPDLIVYRTSYQDDYFRKCWRKEVHIVDTYTSILDMDVNTGEIIYSTTTGGVYLVQPDSTANHIRSGYSIDSVGVIPVLRGYAILQPQEGKISSKAYGIPTDTIGIEPGLFPQALNKALAFCNHIFVEPGNYRSNARINIEQHNFLEFHKDAKVQVIGNESHLYSWAEIPFEIAGGFHYSTDPNRTAWLADLNYYNDQNNDKLQSRVGPIIREVKGKFEISRNVALQHDTLKANGIRIRPVSYDLDNTIGTPVGTFFGIIEKCHVYRTDTALYLMNRTEGASYANADPLETSRIANNAFRIRDNVLDDNNFAIVADTLCNGQTLIGNQLQVNPRSPELTTIGISNLYSKSWSFDGLGYDGYDSLVLDQDQIAIHANLYKFGTEIYGNIQHKYGFLNMAGDLNLSSTSQLQFDDNPFGAGLFVLESFGGRWRFWDKQGNGLHFQSGATNLFIDNSGLRLTGTNRVIGSSGIPIDEIRVKRLDRLSSSDSIGVGVKLHLEDRLQVEGDVDFPELDTLQYSNPVPRDTTGKTLIFTLSIGELTSIDVSNGAATATVPTGAIPGQSTFTIVDVSDNAGINNITIDFNTNYSSSNSNEVLTTNGVYATWWYHGPDRGWKRIR